MFEYLKQYRNVIVTGPQRSGTRICAKMISHDTGLEYLDEVAIMCDSKYELVKYLSRGGYVLQAPGISAYVHMMGLSDELAIVFMMRDTADIIASQERIGWGWEGVERMAYAPYITNVEAPISEIKYQTWKLQRPHITNAYEVEYRSLTKHPLWVDKGERADFHHTQTAVM